MSNERKKLTLRTIIICCVFIPPVGFVMLFIRLLRNKNKKAMMAIGFCLFMFALLLCYSGYKQYGEGESVQGISVEAAVVIMVILTIGVPFLVKGIDMKKQPVRQPDQPPQQQPANTAAQSNDVSEDSDLRNIALTDFVTTIARGSNISINVSSGSTLNGIRPFWEEQAAEDPAPCQKAIKCPYCNGDNVVVEGQVSHCRFCDSFLSYDM